MSDLTKTMLLLLLPFLVSVTLFALALGPVANRLAKWRQALERSGTPAGWPVRGRPRHIQRKVLSAGNRGGQSFLPAGCPQLHRHRPRAARRLTLDGRVARPLGPSCGFVDSHDLVPGAFYVTTGRRLFPVFSRQPTRAFRGVLTPHPAQGRPPVQPPANLTGHVP